MTFVIDRARILPPLGETGDPVCASLMDEVQAASFPTQGIPAFLVERPNLRSY